MCLPFLAIRAGYKSGTCYEFVLVSEKHLPNGFEMLLSQSKKGLVYGYWFFCPVLNEIGRPLYRRLHVQGGDQKVSADELLLDLLGHAASVISRLKEHRLFWSCALRREAAQEMGVTVLKMEFDHAA